MLLHFHLFSFLSTPKLSFQRHVNANTGLKARTRARGCASGASNVWPRGRQLSQPPLAPPPPRGPLAPWIIDGAGSNNDVTTIAPLSVHRLAREISLSLYMRAGDVCSLCVWWCPSVATFEKWHTRALEGYLVSCRRKRSSRRPRGSWPRERIVKVSTQYSWRDW